MRILASGDRALSYARSVVMGRASIAPAVLLLGIGARCATGASEPWPNTAYSPLAVLLIAAVVTVCCAVAFAAGARYHIARSKARLLTDHYSRITRRANDAILLISESGHIVEANDRAVAFYGYSRDELARMDVRMLRAPSTVGDMRQQWTVAGDQGLVFETLHRRRNGEVFPVEVSSGTLEMNGQRYRLSIVRDISERKRVEQELRESEERFRQLVENAPDAIYVNVSGRFRYLNPAAVEMYGACSASDLLGKPVLERVHPEFLERATKRNTMLTNGQASLPVMEQKWLRLDGTVFDVEVSAVPFVYRREPAGLVFVRDITERKRLEEQFRQAQKMESIGRLAGGVAHDFNNYLTVIIGHCEMLALKLGTHDPLRSQIDEIRAAGEKAATLTRQLLAFSRKQVIEPEVLNLNTVVRDNENMLRRMLGEDIELTTHLDDAAGYVMADAGQIGQVLLNLAVNARDAMPNGGRIVIETGRVELDVGGPHTMLGFSDTGHGMDQKTQAQIFEPFFTTKQAGAGTGLGLSLVYGIVKQSNGWITVHSELDRGTTFKIYLPHLDQPLEAAPPRPALARSRRGGETVLVVEDHDDVRGLACQILRAYGYAILEAANGDQALRVCGEHTGHIDLLLTDVVMPAMTGPEMAARVKKLRPETKVLFVSGYTADAAFNQNGPNSRISFLAKPYTPEALAAKVREVLDA